MAAYPLQLDELTKALRRLKEAAALPKNDIVRDSVIQRFEFTVELSWKALARRLRAEGVSEHLTPKSIIREGARLGYIVDPEAWLGFIDDRNLSSHTYKEDIAERVYKTACRIAPFVDDLLVRLQQEP